MRYITRAAALAVASMSTANAITLDLDDSDSIKSACATIAANMVSYYTGNDTGGTPGILPSPYYWWEAGGMFGSLIDYWYYTGDDTYNDITSEALVFQMSPTYDYMPANQSKDEGNDDQVFWAFSVMSAAEYQFPDPPSGDPSWASLAQAVWNSQVARWDSSSCAGGLRWQIYSFNSGYDYKNSPSNGGFVNLGARLYAYTANETYADWVVETWDWMANVGLISDGYAVYDGTDDTENCTSLDHVVWSYSAGMLLQAAAVMWNKTNGTAQDMWYDRAEGLWNTSATTFFKDSVLYEVECEPTGICDLDEESFKAYFVRFVGASIKWAPWLYDKVQPYLEASAIAAAATCTGGTDGSSCGMKWTTGAYDGSTGVGQEMNAMQIIGVNLIKDTVAPVSESTGGTAANGTTLGTGADTSDTVTYAAITTADRAGAGILTAIAVISTLGGAWWLITA